MKASDQAATIDAGSAACSPQMHAARPNQHLGLLACYKRPSEQSHAGLHGAAHPDAPFVPSEQPAAVFLWPVHPLHY